MEEMNVDVNDPATLVAEMQRQRAYFLQQLGQANQANENMRAQFQQALAATQDAQKNAQKAARLQPEYSHDGKKSWTVFCAEREDWMRLHEIGIGVIAEDWHKNAVIASLKGTAREMITGQEERLRGLPWAQFQKELEGVFQPIAETELMRQEFKRKQQGAQEDIVRYLSTKEALFRRAYVYDAGNLRILLESTIKGVYNRAVKERLLAKYHDIDNPMRDFAALRGYATNAVACERSLLAQGLGQSTSMDGLGATGIVHGDSLFNQDGGEPMDIGRVNAMANGGKCFNCDMPGHIARQCPRPKRTGGRGGAGGAGGARKPASEGRDRFKDPCLRCGRKGHWKRECFSKTDIKGKPLPPNQPGKVRNIQEDDGINSSEED